MKQSTITCTYVTSATNIPRTTSNTLLHARTSNGHLTWHPIWEHICYPMNDHQQASLHQLHHIISPLKIMVKIFDKAELSSTYSLKANTC